MLDLDMDSSQLLHPIGYVARRCGLTTHIIRVWEKRYAAITPSRTDTNRRLYSDADIERLILLKQATAQGHSISSVANLGDDVLASLADRSDESTASPQELPKPAAEVDGYLERCKNAVPRLDRHELEGAIREASMVLSVPYFLERLVAPFMRWVGEQWHDGTIQIAHEHFASAAVRDVLYRFSTQEADSELPKIIVCAPNGNHHEIGALLAAGAATLEGWNAIYLGANLPVSEIYRVALEHDAKAVALSSTYMEDPPRLIADVKDLRELLPSSCPIFIGGESAIFNEANLNKVGAHYVTDLQDFRCCLRESQAVASSD
jgi:DNA-binding transcriptional MerR regulator/methylmalonyl-CoA mutase cobalamin-binding subunit